MVKRNYEEIADIIRDSGSRLGSLYVADTEKLMRSLCKYFKKDNKLFIPKKFRDRAKPNYISSIIDRLIQRDKE
jgi:hypothetical protein